MQRPCLAFFVGGGQCFRRRPALLEFGDLLVQCPAEPEEQCAAVCALAASCRPRTERMAILRNRRATQRPTLFFDLAVKRASRDSVARAKLIYGEIAAQVILGDLRPIGRRFER